MGKGLMINLKSENAFEYFAKFLQMFKTKDLLNPKDKYFVKNN